MNDRHLHCVRRALVLVGLSLAAGWGCGTSSSSVTDEQMVAEATTPAPPPVASIPPPRPDAPDMDWWRKSMETANDRLAWFREARFGMFVHWGAYSHAGGIWEGKPIEGYAEHLMRRMKVPTAVYRDKVVAQFNPTQFNADEWISLAKKAGMAYFIITSKHHDGFAMYDSDVSDYNVVKATPWKHDPMKDLREACKKYGVKFGFYYSHAWDWHHPDAPGNDWERDNPGGDRRLFGAKWWDMNPAFRTRAHNYVETKAIPQVRELIAKYDPDIMWFDTPSKMPPDENIRVLKAAREAKPTLVVNSRIVGPVPVTPLAGFGDYKSTTDKPAEFPPQEGAWEGIPTTNESYGWHQGDNSHKPPSHFVQLLAKASARGGNILLNIGPMGNGKIDPKDVAILEGIGEWMKTNGESIRGTDRTPLPVQAWGESTRKGSNRVYLHVLHWPRKGRIVVGGLKSPIRRAYLLADAKHSALPTRRLGELDWQVQGPAKAPDRTDTVVVVETEREVIADKARLLSTDVPSDTLRAFDGQLKGGLGYGAGKARDAYVIGWDNSSESVRWPVRLLKPASFDVAISYDAEPGSAGGTFAVKLGDKTLDGTVGKTPAAPVSLGKVSLPAGSFEIAVEATKIQGGELFKLRGLTLTPAGEAVSRGEAPPSQTASR